MSTRECIRCGGICSGYDCDNDHDPHYCPTCKEKKDMEKLDRVKHVLVEAQLEAARFCHDYVGTEHLLLAVLRHSTSGIFDRLGVQSDKLRREVERLTQAGASVIIADRPLTPRSKNAIELASKEAAFQKSDFVTTDHLLVGLVREGEGIAATALRELGVDDKKVTDASRGMIDFGEPCDHVVKFKKELQALYARNNHFVTLDGTLGFHCHVCSGVHKIPEDLMRKSGKSKEERKGPGRKQVVITRLKTVTSVNVPNHSMGNPTIGYTAIPLSPSVALWLIKAEDDVGEWKETYASEAERDAFVRGFKAASAMHGDHDPTIAEIQRQEP